MYKVFVENNVWKRIKKTPRKERKTLLKLLKELKQFPHLNRTRRIKKLTGKYKGSYRLRIGSHRMLFIEDRENKAISVYKIGMRGDIY